MRKSTNIKEFFIGVAAIACVSGAAVNDVPADAATRVPLTRETQAVVSAQYLDDSGKLMDETHELNGNYVLEQYNHNAKQWEYHNYTFDNPRERYYVDEYTWIGDDSAVCDVYEGIVYTQGTVTTEDDVFVPTKLLGYLVPTNQEQ